MSALTDLRDSITSLDGHLLSRGKIQVELEKAIAAEEAYWTLALSQARIALKLVEDYLVARGIEHRGTVGRTIVLPQIREAIALLHGETVVIEAAPAKEARP